MMAALIFSMVPTSGILAAEMHKRSSGLSSAGETGATSPRIAVIDPLTPPLFAIEHDKVARNAGTENKLLWFRSHRRNGAAVQCASQLELMRRSLSRGTPGLHGASTIVRYDSATEPPAHCRLAFGHDPFELVAFVDCNRNRICMKTGAIGESDGSLRAILFGEIGKRHSLGADMITRARRARRQGRPTVAPQG